MRVCVCVCVYTHIYSVYMCMFVDICVLICVSMYHNSNNLLCYFGNMTIVILDELETPGPIGSTHIVCVALRSTGSGAPEPWI